MGGFPILWEATQSLDQIAGSCPYSAAEIEEYLIQNHYHWVQAEEPTKFRVSGPRAEKADASRRFWLFEAINVNKKELWFVVIGSGKSPFDPRWMYAVTNDEGLSPEHFLEEQYLEQIQHDLRKANQTCPS